MNTKSTIIRASLCLGLAALTSACIARGPEDYRKVTRSAVDTKNAEIEGCFNGEPGKVVVNFTVQKKTGTVADATVDEKASTASAEVGACVAKAITGVTIERGDMRDGSATFTWEKS